MNTPADWSKHFILTASLDLSGIALTPVGTSMLNPFSGSLNGNGYVIRNATIDLPSTDNVGLFGVTSARIRNLVLENVSVRGCYWVGGLAARILNTTCEDVYVTGTITSIGNYAGGLAGSVSYVDLNKCASFGQVNGHTYTGGLFGAVSSTISIRSCYSQSSVQGDQKVGGLIGSIFAGNCSLRHCYSSGSVSGISEVGGLVGNVETSVSWEGCFWDIQASGQTSSPVGVGLSTAEMKRPQVYADADWRLEDWGIAPEQTYPFLRRVPASDLNYSGSVDLEDLEFFASQWLSTVPFPQDL